MRRTLFGILLFLAVLAGAMGGVFWLRTHQRAAGPQPAPPQPGANAPSVPQPVSREVSVYFAREVNSGDYDYNLVPVPRTVTVEPSGSPAAAALTALAQGPTSAEAAQGLTATLPAGTRVLNVSVEGGVATADFSAELKEKFPGGSDWEETVVYSIVDTLTDLDGIRRVRITINGAPVESIGGHVGMKRPLERNTDILARGKGQ